MQLHDLKHNTGILLSPGTPGQGSGGVNDNLPLNNIKKGGQVDVALLYSRLQVGHCIMNGIKFEFNDTISLYKKNDSERRRQIPVINGNKTQTILNTAIKPNILKGQPLNNFHQSFFSSLQNKNLEPSTSKVIPTNKCFVVAKTISHSPLVQASASLSKSATTIPATTTTFLTFKPAVPNNISMVNGALQRAEGSTIIVGNRQYQLVKGPTGQMRAVINKAKQFIKPKPVGMAKCYARNCTKSATIMCSSCTSVKYCSHNCQRLDWYDSHIKVCEQLVKQK